MASTTLMQTKDGRRFYKIAVSHGRGSKYTTRFYIEDGWSARTIESRLNRAVRDFEHAIENGEVQTRAEKRQEKEAAAAEAAKLKTLRQYGQDVFMAKIRVTGSGNTVDGYQRILDNWVYPTLGNQKLTEITSAQISALMLRLQSDGYSYSSVIKCYAILKSLFNDALFDGSVSNNPMSRVKRPKQIKADGKDEEVKAFTQEELSYILSCLEKEPLKWRAYIRLLIDTGIRKGEACGLRWEYVDEKNSTITIAHSLSYTKDTGVYLDTPKSGKKRTISVDPEVMQLIMELRHSSRFVSPYVFTQEDSAEPMHPQSPDHYFRQFKKRYDVEDFHPHKLRHSFASIAITNNADIASVSAILGHADISTTLRMYTHANQESMKRAGDVFRQALKSKKQSISTGT